MKTIIKKLYIPLIGMMLFCTTSCKKFLTSYSQNQSNVNSAVDLDELLIGDAYMDMNRDIETKMFHMMDDDVEMGLPATSQILEFESGLHYWQGDTRINSIGTISLTDVFYNGLYAKIARINTILEEGELLAKREQSELLAKVSGEAHFLRAYYYFQLVNLYGKPYNVSSAASDAGIPLKTESVIRKQFASRSTVKEVYAQIVVDLEKAAQLLAGKNMHTTLRASQGAAYAMLSKVHLFLENYEKSVDYANKVLNLNRYELIDLNNHVLANDFLEINSREVIFSLGQNITFNTLLILHEDIPSRHYSIVSNDLLQIYSEQDLRNIVFFRKNSRGDNRLIKKHKGVSSTITDVSDKFLLRLSEVYLNKAEALTAMGEFEEARAVLQNFRKGRFKSADLPHLSEEGAALISLVRDERRRELCWEGHRWFDLRRYAVNSKYPYTKSIRHRSIAHDGIKYNINGYYELGPYELDEAAYTLPIASDEIEFNQGQIVNQLRLDRPLKQ